VSSKRDFFSKYAVKVDMVKPKRTVFVIRSEIIRDLFKDLIEQYGYESFYISTIVGTDLPGEGRIRLDYYVVLLPEEETIVIRTYLDRNNPVIDTLVDIVPGVFNGECETHDLLGVFFRGNPYLKRGFFVSLDVAEKGVYPLRKDSGV